MNYRKRRNQLFEASEADVIIIPANREQQFSLDQVYPFEQERNFLYLSGLDSPGGLIVITSREHILVTGRKSKVEILFDGGINQKQLNSADFDRVVEGNQANALLKKLITGRVIGLLDFKKHPAHSFLKNPVYALIKKKVRTFQPAGIINIAKELVLMRAVKDSQEIALIDQAAALTIKTLSKLESQLSNFKTEYEVESFITAEFRRQGARHGYTPIVSSGSNSMTIHYAENSSKLEKSSLLIDVGARLEHYNADITRTYNLSNKQLISDTINLVQDVHDRAIAELKPGVMFKDVHQYAFDMMREGTEKLGLGDGSKRQTAQLFPYSLGHFLGLDVHDVGDYSQPLQENMVLTIEPGIHSAKHGFGARVEDDVLITAKGAKILGINYD